MQKWEGELSPFVSGQYVRKVPSRKEKEQNFRQPRRGNKRGSQMHTLFLTILTIAPTNPVFLSSLKKQCLIFVIPYIAFETERIICVS